MKTAVTPEAPAVSTPQSIEDALESGFLPDDPTYLRTGKFGEEKPASAAFTDKEKKDDEIEEKVTPGEGQGDDKTAAASAAAPTEEQKEAERQKAAGKKTPDTSESRWAKITRQNKELREENERLKKPGAQPAATVTRETSQGSQPAAAAAAAKPAPTRPEPKIDEVDPKTNKPKYATYNDFLADQRAWDREQILAEVTASSTKSQKDQQLEQAERVIQQEVNQRVKKARETFTDYDEVMATALEEKNEHGGDLIYIPKGSAIDLFMLDSPRGTDVFYTIAKNLDQYKHIFARDAKGNFTMSAVRQVRELGKIEATLEAPAEKKETPLTPVTKAGRPAHQSSGTGAAAKDAVAQAVEDGDSETYIREQNARDLARRKKG
jgi:hypothetical protein